MLRIINESSARTTTWSLTINLVKLKTEIAAYVTRAVSCLRFCLNQRGLVLGIVVFIFAFAGIGFRITFALAVNLRINILPQSSCADTLLSVNLESTSAGLFLFYTHTHKHRHEHTNITKAQQTTKTPGNAGKIMGHEGNIRECRENHGT